MFIIKLDRQLIRKISLLVFSFQEQNTVESQRQKYSCALQMSHTKHMCRRELSKLEKLKKHSEKNCLYFGKWSFLAPSLKNSYLFIFFSGGNLQCPKNKNFLYFSKKVLSTFRHVC